MSFLVGSDGVNPPAAVRLIHPVTKIPGEGNNPFCEFFQKNGGYSP